MAENRIIDHYETLKLEQATIWFVSVDFEIPLQQNVSRYTNQGFEGKLELRFALRKAMFFFLVGHDFVLNLAIDFAFGSGLASRHFHVCTLLQHCPIPEPAVLSQRKLTAN